MRSDDLSRYPPQMVQGLAEAIAQSLHGEGPPPTATNDQGEPPGRTDRSSSVPLSHGPSHDTEGRPQSLSNQKTRPVRSNIPRQETSSLEAPIQISKPQTTDCPAGTIACSGSPTGGTASIPFSVKSFATQGTLEEAEMVAEGQPFHLDLITALAGGDIDATYPRDVATGVLLGGYNTHLDVGTERRVPCVGRSIPAHG